MNTFEMFILRVNSSAASLPRIPSCMVLFLFFSFAVSSTMATTFLDHVVRDRESIQSSFIQLSSGIAFNQELSACAVDSNREYIENIALSVLFRTTRTTLHCPIHGSSPSNCFVSRRYFAANRLEVLLDEDDFRSSSRALERGNFRLLSQLHVTILAL